MAKLIITVEGGKITQTLNFLDRNIKDNRYVYGNGNESGIISDLEEVYEDVPDCQRILGDYDELLEAVNIGKSQITTVMRQLNDDLERLSKIGGGLSLTTDKDIEVAVKKLIHALGDISLKKKA